MNRCINCTYLITCEKASEEIVECDKFKKISYDTKITKQTVLQAIDGIKDLYEEKVPDYDKLKENIEKAKKSRLHYDTKLVKVDGLNYKFEEVK